MQIEHDAHTTLTAEILRSIIVPEAKPKDISGKAIPPAEWPGLERPMQQRQEWWKWKGILKDPDDRYTYYFAIAKQCRPIIIAEIGVYYGYSLMAMAQGAIAGGIRQVPGEAVAVNGFDNEQYAPGCLEWARQGFMDENIMCNLMHMDTQKQTSLPLHMVQLASIDGDHTYESAFHDLELMEPCMVPRPRLDAVMIVDDVGWAMSVKNAAIDFAAKYGYQIMWLPTHKGTAVLERI